MSGEAAIYPKATSPATWAALEAANDRADRWMRRCHDARAERDLLQARLDALDPSEAP